MRWRRPEDMNKGGPDEHAHAATGDDIAGHCGTLKDMHVLLQHTLHQVPEYNSEVVRRKEVVSRKEGAFSQNRR